MKHFIRITALLLVMVMAAPMTLNAGAASAAGNAGGELTLPAALKAVEAEAFAGDTSLTVVNIPDGCTYIGAYAFYGCRNLERVTIPDSVRHIGWNAFDKCDRLTIYCNEDSAMADYARVNGLHCISDGFIDSDTWGSLTWRITSDGELILTGTGAVPGYDSEASGAIAPPWHAHLEDISSVWIGEGVTALDDYAFSGYRLTRIHLPQTLNRVGAKAFYNASVPYVSLPDSVTYLGEAAFAHSSARRVRLSAGMKTIPEYCFEASWDHFFGYGSSLAEVILPEGIEEIGADAFNGCVQLTGIDLPDSLRVVGDRAFESCEKLKDLKLPEGVKTIGEDALYCTSIEEIELPDSIETIGRSALLGLKAVSLLGNGPSFDGCCQSHAPRHSGISMPPYNNTSLESVEIGEGCNEVSEYAFSRCTNLKRVSIADTVKTICQNAFMNCAALTSLDLPDSVTTIGASAFSGCTGLKDISIPESVTSIDETAFSGCESVTIHTTRGSAAAQLAAAQGYAVDYEMPLDIAAQCSFNGHTYWLIETPMTPMEAAAYCKALGGYLATITSGREDGYLSEYLLDGGKAEAYWIGATDHDTEGTWRWMNGENWDWTNWYLATEPNNGGRSEPGSEDYCVVSRSRGWQWVDCYGSRFGWYERCGFICEFSSSPTASGNVVNAPVRGTWNGHNYWLIENQLTPPDAEEFCKAIGGYLATITSAEEEAYIDSLCEQAYGATGADDFVIGATDRGTMDEWFWMNGEAWGHENWYPGGSAGTYEPNNGWLDVPGGNDYCTKEKSRGWKWVDVFGSNDYRVCPFICEFGNGAQPSADYCVSEGLTLHGDHEADPTPDERGTMTYDSLTLTEDEDFAQWHDIIVKNDMTIKGDITVSLTDTDLTVGGKLTVQKGAKLVLNQGTNVTVGSGWFNSLVLEDGAELTLNSGSTMSTEKDVVVGTDNGLLFDHPECKLTVCANASLTVGKKLEVKAKGYIEMSGGKIEANELLYNSDDSSQSMYDGTIVVKSKCTLNKNFHAYGKHVLQMDGTQLKANVQGATVGTLVVNGRLDRQKWDIGVTQDGLQTTLSVARMVVTDEALKTLLDVAGNYVNNMNTCITAANDIRVDVGEESDWTIACKTPSDADAENWKPVAAEAMGERLAEQLAEGNQEITSLQALLNNITSMNPNSEKWFIVNHDSVTYQAKVISVGSLALGNDVVVGNYRIQIKRDTVNKTLEYTCTMTKKAMEKAKKQYAEVFKAKMYKEFSTAMQNAAKEVPYVGNAAAQVLEIYMTALYNDYDLRDVILGASAQAAYSFLCKNFEPVKKVTEFFHKTVKEYRKINKKIDQIEGYWGDFKTCFKEASNSNFVPLANMMETGARKGVAIVEKKLVDNAVACIKEGFFYNDF